MDTIDKLSSYIEALRPIIYIPTFDFYAFDEIISEVSNSSKIYEYNEGLGYVNFKTKNPRDRILFRSVFKSLSS